MAAAMAMAMIPAVITFHHGGRHGAPMMHRRARASLRTSSVSPLSCSPRDLHGPSAGQKDKDKDEVLDDDEPFSVLTALKSHYNEIVVVDTPTSRVLLLDSTHNIHSMLNKEQKWTGSYWDDFATLPAIVPEGPIAVLGLGGGTAAHLMLDLWPSLQIEGWEIDGILIDMAREYFGLSNLEKCTKAGGYLTVHIGDALSPSAMVQGGFAGIIVDLFSDGKILPQLLEDTTWLELGKKLMPHGRIMVNCAGVHSRISDDSDRTIDTDVSLNGSWVQNSTIEAMIHAFPGELSWKRIRDKDNDNYLALTGSLPDLNAWSSALPSPLSFNVKQWRPCQLS